jgi:DMSO/TMAO reductase YedYZ molybdopterin-dependent catalytic subunit
VKRALFIASSLGAALGGCAPIGTAMNNSDAVRRVLGTAESLDFASIGAFQARAREYPASAIAPVFRVNGFATPADPAYSALVRARFKRYRLVVDGSVDKPLSLGLEDLARFEQVSQITRHDCVEGWSVIGKWTGVRLGAVIDAARPRRGAFFVILRCMDRDDSGIPYYESLDLVQAHHPQTLLATRLNDKPLDPDHGAPVRLRVPTQLGYKSAKWVKRIEIASSLSRFGSGKGGYWEDRGYEWYAGI